MESSPPSEVGPVEDVVQALLEYLVAPLLPLKSSGHQVPSLAQQQSVAKQVHAAVLLYNYYHRKQQADIEYLGFESFCKLAVTLKPQLMGYMKLMHRSDYAELDDLEEQLSVTEKAIMSACDISLALDASKDAPCIEGWPVSKVAVLVTDSSKDHCLLQFSSITHGVWSVIEKDYDLSSVSSERTVEGQYVYKRKRNTKKSLRNETNSDEADFRKLVISAVKEVTGINESDLVVLESHVVYSLSKEKTSVYFYIVQCSQTISEDLQVPIKDVIDRKVSSNGLQGLRPVSQNGIINSEGVKNLCDKEVIEDRDDSNAAESVNKKASGTTTECLKERDENGSGKICLADSFIGPQNMEIDESSTVSLPNENENLSMCNVIEVDHHQKGITSFADNDIGAKTSGLNSVKVKVEMDDSMKKSCVAVVGNENIDSGNKTCSIISSVQDELPIGDCALGRIQLSSKYLQKLHGALATKENVLTQTALRVLLRKRYKLACQLRNLEDEIAVNERNIHTILDGSEHDLAAKIEAIVDSCDDVCLKSDDVCLKSNYGTQDRTCQQFEDEGSSEYRRKKRLSEAVLSLRNSCQALSCVLNVELDDICYENNWTLPTYHVLPTEGGFRANITVKGVDFECSGGSDMHSIPRLARESAASQLLAKLRTMAVQSQ
ncbi:hypothetical protein RHGRI_004047 [Rhododendron griersonianum]|uniref:DRBM domain-containing protein n=1 Tax=Rhododendron griersonianum TaxID=479676 RepID=A0AAV6L9G4_9ERIC|nr:hypothetical protein RHGRI_004047 [Rhododendron griersonianum]KAG5560891.1 hypothetical protein RHGRI_004047 [Rhododendron griersonianum]